ncbi:MAG: UDP-2,3-diacylglucosamine diphosphatase [Candidatus Neomarinimicrobiota bacterium]
MKAHLSSKIGRKSSDVKERGTYSERWEHFICPWKRRSVSFRAVNSPLFFISDIHLGLKNSNYELRKRERLAEFVRHVVEKKGSLFIVGDLFDFWFEYKYVMPKAYFDILTVLYEAKRKGVKIYFIPGNHDYWTGEFAEKIIFTEVYPDGCTLEFNGKRFHIIHGDGLLSRDGAYRALRRLFRNKLFVFFYRWLHPDWGYSIAKWISRTGNHKAHSEEYDEAVLKELKEFASNHGSDGVDFVIMGHYHQARQVDLGSTSLVILGDWLKYHSFGYFDGNEFSLNYWR